MEKILRWIINIILICVIIHFSKPVVNKGIESYENKKTYERAIEEKEKLVKEEKIHDWITVSGTKINYPVVYKAKDNSYYLKHDIYGNESVHGSIFYDGNNDPFSTNTTILYGHCMKDKSMFATLHYFREDEAKFRESKVTIETKTGEIKKFKPLGLYVTNENFFYSKLHRMELNEAVSMIKENSRYDINVNYNENSKIIVLMTCSYEHEGDRLFCFYISE